MAWYLYYTEGRSQWNEANATDRLETEGES